MYFSVQNYPPPNPRPYDDTGWTMQYMRNVKLIPVTDKAVLDQPMTMLSADVQAPGGIEGSGDTLVIEHTTDNALMTFRFKQRDVKMLAAEDDFERQRPQIPRRRVHYSQCRPRTHLQPSIQRAGPFRRGPFPPRRR